MTETGRFTAAADALDQLAEEAYPDDIFRRLPPEFDYAMLDRWLSDTFGFRIDRLSAELYRRALHVGAKHLRDMEDEK